MVVCLLIACFAGDHHADAYCTLLQCVPSELAGVAVCGGSGSRVYVAGLAGQSVFKVGFLSPHNAL